MATKKEAKKYLPVWLVGYGSHTLTLAAKTAEEAIREGMARDSVMAALPLTAEPIVTDDGYQVVAEVTLEEEDIL